MKGLLIKPSPYHRNMRHLGETHSFDMRMMERILERFFIRVAVNWQVEGKMYDEERVPPHPRIIIIIIIDDHQKSTLSRLVLCKKNLAASGEKVNQVGWKYNDAKCNIEYCCYKELH
jgi:hypothetical protein